MNVTGPQQQPKVTHIAVAPLYSLRAQTIIKTIQLLSRLSLSTAFVSVLFCMRFKITLFALRQKQMLRCIISQAYRSMGKEKLIQIVFLLSEGNRIT